MEVELAGLGIKGGIAGQELVKRGVESMNQLLLGPVVAGPASFNGSVISVGGASPFYEIFYPIAVLFEFRSVVL